MRFGRAVESGDPELEIISCDYGGGGPRYFRFESRSAMMRAAHAHRPGPACALRDEHAMFDDAPGRLLPFCDQLGGMVIQPAES